MVRVRISLCWLSWGCLIPAIFTLLVTPPNNLNVRQYNQPLDTGNPLAVGTLPENQAVEETLALNGGLTTPSNDKLPTDTPVSNDGGVNFNDQLVGDSLAANTGSNQPLNEPLGEVFALNAGGAMNNQPSVEATLLNEGNILDSHSSDELFIGDKENDPNGDSGSAFNPPDPCNPGYQQSAKLRARYDCEKKPKKPKKPSDTPSQGFGPNIPAKESFPRPETRLKIPVFGPGFRGNNDECFRYTFGLLPLGVCDSEQPNKRFFSTYTYHGAHFFRLEDADLAPPLSSTCHGNSKLYCCYQYKAAIREGDICQKLEALKATAPPGV